jgi:hypothetical protein
MARADGGELVALRNRLAVGTGRRATAPGCPEGERAVRLVPKYRGLSLREIAAAIRAKASRLVLWP